MLTQCCCYADECRTRYLELVQMAGQQGLTELQLLHAAVGACGSSCATTAQAPDAEAARLKLLVRMSSAL